MTAYEYRVVGLPLGERIEVWWQVEGKDGQLIAIVDTIPQASRAMEWHAERIRATEAGE
jgi:hypothetical protein